MNAPEIRAIRDACWPALAHLEIRPGLCDEQTVDEISELIASTSFPKLDALAIVDTYQLTETRPISRVLDTLRRSALLRQLRILDLRKTQLDDDHAQRIARAASAFQHLEALVVSDNRLTAKGVRRLRSVVKRVIS